jgi:hypothetical protein
VGATPNSPAAPIGRLHGRTIGPRVALAEARRLLDAGRRRRLAVVDDDGVLIGLLCLKRSGRGFCADSDIAARQHGGGPGRSHAPEFGTEAASAEMGDNPWNRCTPCPTSRAAPSRPDPPTGSTPCGTASHDGHR